MQRKAIELSNDSPHKFTDISSEQFREYNFGSKGFVHVVEPDWLSAGPNGHRVVNSAGESFYIPSGWLNIRWKAEPHFVK